MANEAGSGCNNLASGIGGYTFISNVPASLSGNCDRLAFFGTAESDAANFAFFTRSGDDFTTVAGTRQTLTVTGSGARCVEFNAPGDFTAFAVSAGNYLGLYGEDHQDYTNTGGLDVWGLVGDYTDVSAETFDFFEDHDDALTADISAAAGGMSTTIAIANLNARRRRLGSGSNSGLPILCEKLRDFLHDTFKIQHVRRNCCWANN